MQALKRARERERARQLAVCSVALESFTAMTQLKRALEHNRTCECALPAILLAPSLSESEMEEEEEGLNVCKQSNSRNNHTRRVRNKCYPIDEQHLN